MLLKDEVKHKLNVNNKTVLVITQYQNMTCTSSKVKLDVAKEHSHQNY